MKNTSIFSAAVGIFWITSFSTAQGQMSPYKFNQLFNEAFTNVLTGECQEAIPVLEKLSHADEGNAQVSFLLAMSYLNTGQKAARSVSLLEQAAVHFSMHAQMGMPHVRFAPSKVWWFLAEAYERTGQFKESLNAYGSYMTVIPLASTAHKRKVIARMDDVRILAQQHEGAILSHPSIPDELTWAE